MPALLADWPFHPTIIAGVLLAAVLYWRGLSYSQSRGLARHVPWWRAAAFAAALLVLLLALDSPLESLADRFLWAHMLQHELLTLGVAPLLLFSAPWLPLWRSVPLPARRSTLRWILRRRWPRRLWHQLTRVLWTPTVAWLLFAGVFSLWHIPALYDLARATMDVFVTIVFFVAIVALLGYWLQEDERAPDPARRSAIAN